MFRKLFTQQSQDLETALKLLYVNKVLLDYAAIIPAPGGFTQIIRVKCDDAALTNILAKRFKKKIKIIK